MFYKHHLLSNRLFYMEYFIKIDEIYSISESWEIFSKFSQKILKHYPNSDWYASVCIYKKTKTVHRMVATLFIPNPLNLPHINHKDWNKMNCRKDNLEWCTQSQNELHSYRILWKKPNKTWTWRFSEKHPRSKPILQYSLSWEFIREWSCSQDVQRELSFCYQHILSCAKWKLRQSRWFVWRFKNSSNF